MGLCRRRPEASATTEAGALQTNERSGIWCQTVRETQKSPGSEKLIAGYQDVSEKMSGEYGSTEKYTTESIPSTPGPFSSHHVDSL